MYAKEYKDKNREKVLKAKRENNKKRRNNGYRIDKQKAREYRKRYKAKNKDKILSYNLKYYQLHKEKINAYRNNYYATLERKFISWERSAKARNIKWELTLEDIKEMPLTCYYSGVELSLKGCEPNSISLDRLDSSKGYTKDNVVFCTVDINRMKWTITEDHFTEICKQISDNYKKRNPALS
jgi:hypothetical protein